MSPAVRRVFAKSLSLVSIAAATIAAAEEPRAEFSDALEVRELVVRFDDSVLPRLESIGRRADDDFLVTSNGVSLARIESASSESKPADPSPLTFWFDRRFATAAERARAAKAAAEALGRLDQPLEVELVSDRPSLRRRFPREQLDAAIGTLGFLAGQWATANDEPLEEGARERALDLLVVDRFERRVELGALVLAVGRVATSFEELAQLERTNGDGSTVGASSPIEESVRLLAASGWALLPLCVPPPSEPLGADTPPDLEEIARQNPRSPLEQPARKIDRRKTTFTLWSSRKPPEHGSETAIDLALDLSLALWKPLARAGGGALVGDARALAARVERIAGRRRLVVRAPDSVPGALHRLDVRWIGGDGRALPTLRWRASGEPAELQAARRRALAADDAERSKPGEEPPPSPPAQPPHAGRPSTQTSGSVHGSTGSLSSRRYPRTQSLYSPIGAP